MITRNRKNLKVFLIAISVLVLTTAFVIVNENPFGEVNATDENMNLEVGASLNLFPSTWIEKKSTQKAGAWGEAVVSTSSNVYIAWCRYATTSPEFWRYDPSTNEWSYSMNVSGLPTGAFRSGTALAWDHDDYIYALLGARGSDSNRRLFYRYSISGDSWSSLTDSPHAQGAGDAITWSEDGKIYAIMGSNKLGESYFARYDPSTNSWEELSPAWTVTDDGCSLVWTGGEYLYALRGEWHETIPNGDFARYDIPTGTWQDVSPIPESEGVGDGASLFWTDEYSEYIFALGGGSCYPEEPGYNFYYYNISNDSWEQLESIPYPIGEYVGNRLGFANGHIYYWQGTPSTWSGGGNAFCMYEMLGGGPTFVNMSPQSQSAHAGKTFTVNINIDPWEPIAGAQADLLFDPSLITVNSVTDGGMFGMWFNANLEIDNVNGAVRNISAIDFGSVTTPGVFAVIEFTAGSIDGTSPLNLTNVIVGDPNGMAVAIDVNNGNVTVIPYPDWDVNMDDSVNILDLIIVGQHWGETGEPGWIRADVNKDGVINILDLILIGQHWTG